MSTESQPINSAPVVENEAKNVEDPKKVFAGNLAFSTTEAEVKEMFSVAGTVTDVSLITRGTRSLGYGFVTFSTEAEAKKAAEILNKKEVGGREINVESARPQNSAPGAAANGLKKKSNNKKKATGPRARRPRNEQGEEGGETAAESATEGAAGATGETKSAKKRNKKAAAKKEVAEAADGALAAEVEGKAKKPITKRQPRPKVAPTGEPSKTTLFVSNLSWSIDDEKLKTIFGSYKVKTATVIRHKYGNQRSKGFGFVDFESEEEQQKALNNEQGKIHDEREIHMRVALVNDKKDEESKPAEETAANPAVETPLAA